MLKIRYPRFGQGPQLPYFAIRGQFFPVARLGRSRSSGDNVWLEGGHYDNAGDFTRRVETLPG